MARVVLRLPNPRRGRCGPDFAIAFDLDVLPIERVCSFLFVPLFRSGTFFYDGSNYAGPAPKIDRPEGGFFCRPFGWFLVNTRV
jgi:hypothetical protein